jgi:hypothetical protein
MKITMLISVASAWDNTNRGKTVDVPDEVGMEWCRIGYAKPASPPAKEKATSKITPEVRENGTQGDSNSSNPAINRTNNTGTSKKPSKD